MIIQLENFAPEVTVVPPKLISEITGFSQGIRDFVYQKDKGNLSLLKDYCLP